MNSSKDICKKRKCHTVQRHLKPSLEGGHIQMPALIRTGLHEIGH